MNRLFFVVFGCTVAVVSGCKSREATCGEALVTWKELRVVDEKSATAFAELCNLRTSSEAKCLVPGPLLLTFDEVLRMVSRDESKIPWVEQRIVPGWTNIRKKYRVIREPAPTPECETVLTKFESDFETKLTAASAAAARGRQKELDQLDWDKVPVWSAELQIDANGGDKECAEADALVAKKVTDEFERKENEAATERARQACTQRVAAQRHTLPQRVRVDFKVALDGEFDFGKNFYPLKLVTEGEDDCFTEKTGSERRCPPVGAVRELQMDEVDGKNALAIIVSPFGAVAGHSRLPYYSGIAVVPVPESIFSSGRNTLRFSVASVDQAKAMKAALTSGATAQLVIEPGDPAAGTDLRIKTGEGAAAAFLAKTLSGVRARPVAIRLLAGNQQIGSPIDLRAQEK